MNKRFNTIVTAKAALPLAAVFLLAACSAEEAETAPAKDGFNVPLLISARIGGLPGDAAAGRQSGWGLPGDAAVRRQSGWGLPSDAAARRQSGGGLPEVRSTHPEGVPQSGTTWYLSCPLAEYVDKPEQGGLGVLKATFNGGDYAELSDTAGKPVQLTWSMLKPWGTYNYLFVLDNFPRNVFSERNFYSKFNGTDDNTYIGRGVMFTREEIDSCKAALETEDGKINSNDIIQGYATFTNADVGKKVYLPISLKHLMARFSVEISSSALSLKEQPMKVWIDHIASESYALNRLRGGQFESLSLVIHPLKNDVIYDPDSADEDFYDHTFYLLGSESSEEKPLAVEGRTDTFRTRRLILPPQSTHLNSSEAALRPRLHIEVGGKRYSALLPSELALENSSAAFDEFRSGQDIILHADISDKPPHITFSARVQRWNDMGSWVLETQRGGIYSNEDFSAAVKAFDAYVEEQAKDPLDSASLEKRKHELDRYGHWDVKDFIFDFFASLGQGESELPDSLQVKEKDSGSGLFQVNLNAHTVYGCAGTTSSGNVELKSKMLGKEIGGVSTGEKLKEALQAFIQYLEYVKKNPENSQEVEEERTKKRAELEQYGWWVQPSGGGFWTLHINIKGDITEDWPSDVPDMKPYSALSRYFPEIEMNGHTVWGYDNVDELKKKLFGTE